MPSIILTLLFLCNPSSRWAYKLSVHELYSILVQIESRCKNRLHIALSILFVEWIVAVIIAIFGPLHGNRATERAFESQVNQRILNKYAKRYPSIKLEPLRSNTSFQDRVFSEKRTFLYSRQETAWNLFSGTGFGAECCDKEEESKPNFRVLPLDIKEDTQISGPGFTAYDKI